MSGRIDQTADGMFVSAGDIIWSPDNLANGLVVSEPQRSGRVVLKDGTRVHMVMHFFKKKNAMFHKRQTISDALNALKTDQNTLAASLKRLDGDIASEPD